MLNINAQYANHQGGFELTFKSANTGITKTYQFNALSHFNNWAIKMRDSDADSFDTGKKEAGGNNAFDYASASGSSGSKPAGGCNKHKVSNKKIETSFYTFNLINSVSENNNCLFHSLNHLGVKCDIKKLRKQFNLPAGEKITVDDAYKIIEKNQIKS